MIPLYIINRVFNVLRANTKIGFYRWEASLWAACVLRSVNCLSNEVPVVWDEEFFFGLGLLYFHPFNFPLHKSPAPRSGRLRYRFPWQHNARAAAECLLGLGTPASLLSPIQRFPLHKSPAPRSGRLRCRFPWQRDARAAAGCLLGFSTLPFPPNAASPPPLRSFAPDRGNAAQAAATLVR